MNLESIRKAIIERVSGGQDGPKTGDGGSAIRKLRRKLVIVMMSIISLLLTVVFAALYYTSCTYYERTGMEALRSALQESVSGADFSSRGIQQSLPPQPTAPPDQQQGMVPVSPPPCMRERLSVIVADYTGDGMVRVLYNRIYGIEEEAVSDLIFLADSLGNSSGVLAEQSLRYTSMEIGPGLIRYAFMDIYSEQTALYWQLIHSILVGIGALAVFFVFSIGFSAWAVRPVSEAWEQQRQFMADASHELKTPLTVILSNANMLIQSQELPAGYNRQRAEYIQTEAVRMKHLVENLLLLARSDFTEPAFFLHRSVDLSYLVNNCIMAFEPAVYESGRLLAAQVVSGIYVSGDEQKLRQMLEILLDNACKYSEEGSCIQVVLSLNGKEACVSVSSQGTPLTKEELRLIFHRFYRTDPARSRIPGYGLGLPIARTIAAGHGGRIEASSDGISENIFSIFLPLLFSTS